MKPNKVRIEALKPSQKSYMKYNDLVLSIWFQISWHAIQGFLGKFLVLNASIFFFVLSRSISIGTDTAIVIKEKGLVLFFIAAWSRQCIDSLIYSNINKMTKQVYSVQNLNVVACSSQYHSTL